MEIPRRLLPLALLVAGASLACTVSGDNNGKALTKIADQANVAVNYPELTALKPKDGDIVQTASSYGIWLNYSDVSLSHPAILGMYQHFEKLALNHPAIPLQTEIMSSSSVIPSLRPISKRLFFVIGQNMPRPSWAGSFTLAATRPDQDPIASFIKAFDPSIKIEPDFFDSYPANITWLLATEVCQSLVSFDITGEANPLIRAQVNQYARERLCNSWSLAYAAMQMGLPYRDYQQLLNKKITYKPIGGQEIKMNLIDVSLMGESFKYSSIPKVGLVVR